MATTRQPLPYTPSAPADNTDQSRAVWDELYRISQHLAQIDAQIAALDPGAYDGTWDGTP